MRTAGALARAHLGLRLAALNEALRRAVAQRAALTAALDRPELASLAVTDQHAGLLVERVARFAVDGPAVAGGVAVDPAEQAVRAEAAAAGYTLPADALGGRGLSRLDVDALLLVAAPDLEPAYAGLYAYVHDAVGARRATPQLCATVLADGPAAWTAVVEATGAFGRLRRSGLVAAHPGEHPLRVPLAVAEGVPELLTGGRADVALLGRPPGPPPAATALPGSVDAAAVAALADAFAAGRLDVVGVWGAATSGRDTVAAALVGGRGEARCTDPADLVPALQAAALGGDVCVVEVPADDTARAGVADLVAVACAPVVLVGETPLRSNALATARNYAEIQIGRGGFAAHRRAWAAAFPELPPATVDDLAARFRLGPGDVAAVVGLDRGARAWARNGHRPGLDVLAGRVTRRRSPRLAAIRTPTRGPASLVLPPVERAQVLEIAAAYRAWPAVSGRWDLGRFGNPGVVALFTGDPGTGKTLAAEVIAHEVGLDLMTVDLSRLVSKWIGETEQNLDAVFTEAETAHCVLLFDEADALFGKRGEVSRGSDRYANLEVGYLLQRLEQYEGLVLLASNLPEGVDAAFTRRFHHIVRFPRPDAAQRREMWERVLAAPVVLAGPVDWDALARLDLTGAGIAAAVRSSALMAHAAGDTALTWRHLAAGVARQFRREARLLPRGALDVDPDPGAD